MRENTQKSDTNFLLFGIIPLKLVVKWGKWAIAVLGLLILLAMWQRGTNLVTEIETLFRLEVKEPEVDISTIIVEKVRSASELTTAVYTTETVVPTHQDREIAGIFQFRTKLLYIASGEVEAGIDLARVTTENITIANNRIYLQLPAPQILDAKIDVARSRIYDYDRGFLNLGPDAAGELQTLAQQTTLTKIVASACEGGLLDEANERAKIAITQLLNLAGHQEVIVTTTSPYLKTCQTH
ncbi:MAG: DUF4230 domain-containing protein [Cyanobacteria bacterium SBLK]|nr:DUF4230 domain-containing protein [Cyanobacteria bacterium SBLK]